MNNYRQNTKVDTCVVKIKSLDRTIVAKILRKVAELNDSGFRVVHGFIQRERDGTGYVVFVNILSSN